MESTAKIRYLLRSYASGFFALCRPTNKFQIFTGKQAKNPLVLLGQCSDDEMDDGSSGEQNKAVAEDSLVMPDDDQASLGVTTVVTSTSQYLIGHEKLAAGQGREDFGVKKGNGLTADKVEQLAVENGPALMESLEKLQEDVGAGFHAVDTDVVHDADGLTEQLTAASTSDTQVVADVSSGWKIVLHEESNQYYYWNSATGETSWKVPGVLTQATELKSNAVDHKRKDKGVCDAINENSETTEVIVHVPTTEILNEGYVGDALDNKKGDHERDALDDFGTSPGTNVSPWKLDDVLPGDSTASNTNLLKPGHKGCYETGTDLFSPLMKQCENLLEQLNIVMMSKGPLQGHDCIPKYLSK